MMFSCISCTSHLITHLVGSLKAMQTKVDVHRIRLQQVGHPLQALGTKHLERTAALQHPRREDEVGIAHRVVRCAGGCRRRWSAGPVAAGRCPYSACPELPHHARSKIHQVSPVVHHHSAGRSAGVRAGAFGVPVPSKTNFVDITFILLFKSKGGSANCSQNLLSFFVLFVAVRELLAFFSIIEDEQQRCQRPRDWIAVGDGAYDRLERNDEPNPQHSGVRTPPQVISIGTSIVAGTA